MVHLALDLDGGGGPIFKVPLLQLDAKEHPGKLPTQSSLFE